VRCSKCGAENPEGLKFCEQCAAPFKQCCARCGFENSPAARFCGECAAPLDSSPEAASLFRPVTRTEVPASLNESTADHPAAELDGERKTVTALFADIKGSMELIEDLDPEEARAIVDPALKLMIEAIHHYGGYVA
jgi:Double zinc ribbon